MSGNYVALNVSTNAFDLLDCGTQHLDYDPHITLMYSAGTKVSHADALQAVSNRYLNMLKLVTIRPSKVSVFVAPDNDQLCSVVLEIDNAYMQILHSCLISAGMRHAFDPFKPHLTIAFRVQHRQADEIRRQAELLLDKFEIRVLEAYAQDLE